MPRGLRRFQETGHSHFVTFSCYRRQPFFSTPELCNRFVETLEDTRARFGLYVYGYVVMPEHVHLLVSEPPGAKLADALHYLKLSFAKRTRGLRRSLVPQVRARFVRANLGTAPGSFWQKRYHDRNVRNYHEFSMKLRYLHRNPVTRGLVREPAEWKWSSFRHYALREIGVVAIESEWAARDREAATQGKERVFLTPG